MFPAILATDLSSEASHIALRTCNSTAVLPIKSVC